MIPLPAFVSSVSSVATCTPDVSPLGILSWSIILKKKISLLCVPSYVVHAICYPVELTF